MKTEELKMVTVWDKTFPKSEKVDHKKIMNILVRQSRLSSVA